MNDVPAFTTYEALVAAMRARRISIGLSQLDVDYIAGVPAGYVAKCEAMLTNPSAKNARGMGRDSMPKLLSALGDQMTLLSLMRTAASHQNSKEITAASIGGALKTKLSERGRKGGRIRTARMTKKQLRASARKAARARWEKHRKEKAATKRSRCAVTAAAE